MTATGRQLVQDWPALRCMGRVLPRRRFNDGPPKALEGSGSAGRARLSIHFKISLKTEAHSGECAFGFPLLSCRGYAACAVGFSFLGIPVCLTPVFSPRVWTSRGLSMFLLHIPSRGRAVLTRATMAFYESLPPATVLYLPSLPSCMNVWCWLDHLAPIACASTCCQQEPEHLGCRPPPAC